MQKIFEQHYGPDDAPRPFLGYRDLLRSFPELYRESISIIYGHFGFGVHKCFCNPCAYITILRDPLERVVSYYYHWSNFYLYNYSGTRPLEEHYMYRPYMSGLEGFASWPGLDNGQTRMISGWSPWFERPCTRNQLDLAKDNIQKHFAVVGLLERFNETLVLLQRRFGWANIPYTKQNVNPNRPRIEEIPRKTLTVIEQHNKFDLELYEFAKRRFEEQLSQG